MPNRLHRRTGVRPRVLVLSLFLLSCGGDSTGPGPDPEPPPTVQPITAAAVTLSASQTTLQVGASLQLTASAVDKNGNALSRTFTWASSNAAVAAVNAAGQVQALSPGTATITASTDGRSGSVVITVQAATPSTVVTLAPVQAVVKGSRSVSGGLGVVSCTMGWTATVTGNGGATWTDYTWTLQADVGSASSKTEALSGAVTQGSHSFQGSWQFSWATNGTPDYRPFNVTLQMGFTEQGQRKQTAPVTLRCEPEAAAPPGNVAITVSPSTFELAPGATRQLTATVTGTTNTAVLWTTSNSGVASVSATGLVTGSSPGTAQITARSVADTSKRAIALATVTLAPTVGYTLIVNPASATVVRGQNLTFTVSAARTATFTGEVTLGTENLPSGVTATFSPATLTLSQTVSTMTLSTSAYAPSGTTQFRVTGRATGLANEIANVSLTINASGNPVLVTGTSGSGYGSVNPTTGSYAPGTTVSVTAVPDLYYAFKQWDAPSHCAGRIAPCSITFGSSDVTAIARFEPRVWTADASGMYGVRYDPAGPTLCLWDVTHSDLKIEIQHARRNGTDIGILRVTGRRVARNTSGGCAGSDVNIDKTVEFPAATRLNVQVVTYSASGETETMTVAINEFGRGISASGVAIFNYTGADRSGSVTRQPVSFTAAF